MAVMIQSYEGNLRQITKKEISSCKEMNKKEIGLILWQTKVPLSTCQKRDLMKRSEIVLYRTAT